MSLHTACPTVKNSDVIMVLDHGRIIERGNHEKLIAEHGTHDIKLGSRRDLSWNEYQHAPPSRKGRGALFKALPSQSTHGTLACVFPVILHKNSCQ